MVLDGLLPTTYTPLEHLQATQRVLGTTEGSTGWDENFTNAYWLGWVNYDNLPVDYHISYMTRNNDIITFSDITTKANYDVGYAYGQADTGAYYAGVARYRADTNLWTPWDNNAPTVETQSSYMRMLNEFDINTMGISTVIPIFAIDVNSEVYCMAYTTVGVNDFINGTFANETVAVLSFDTAGNPSQYGSQFTITKDDITGDIVERTVDNKTYRIVCVGLEVVGQNFLNNDYLTQSSYVGNIKPFFRINSKLNGENYIINSYNAPYGSGFFWLYGDGYAFNQRYGIFWDYTTGGNLTYQNKPYNTGEYNNVIAGNFEGSFSASEAYDKFFNRILGIWKPDGCNFILQGTNAAERVMIRRAYKYEELLKLISFYPRMCRDNNNTYDNGSDKWYALVSEENEFMGELANGVTDRAKLRDWQLVGNKVNAESNTYTEDDKPDYNPEDDSEESGESVPIRRRVETAAVSSFLTTYALSPAQVVNFGKYLWQSFVSANDTINQSMVENFKFLFDNGIASTTGSIDVASVMDFIVSLQVYPFDLTHAQCLSNDGMDSKVYIGRGTFGIETDGNNLFKVVNQIGYLSAGSVDVPRVFNDFRDYENMNIVVHVPYCGTLELNPGDVIGRTLQGTYAIDMLSGECTFYLEVMNAPGDSGELRYTVGAINGQLGITLPITATNQGQIVGRRIKDITGMIESFSNWGLSRYRADTMNYSRGLKENSDEIFNERMANSGRWGANLKLGSDLVNQYENTLSRAAIKAPMIPGGSGIASFASPDCVYLQMRYGIYPTVANYNHSVGRVSTRSTKLSFCKGWTVCHNVDVSSLPCTEEEKASIKTLLESGVFL